MDEDATLVDRARRGDPDAFAGLIRRHQGLTRAVAASVLGAAADVDDVTQEAFVRAWTNLDLLADPARFGPWLARIAFAAAIDARRRARPAAALEEAADPGPRADEALAAHEVEAAVRAAIARLPPRYRRPLVLYHLDGIRHERVAAALGVAPGTARSLVTRARQALRAQLAAPDAVDELLADPRARAVLHVVNGDATRVPLEAAGVPGRVVLSADALLDGPCPPVWGPAWWDARAGFRDDPAGERARLEAWDRALEDAATCEEVVLWYEHDLFDQLLLVRLLAWFDAHPPPRLSLVSIGAHPDVPRFKSLGELSPDALASLYETRRPVDATTRALGRAAWEAYTAPDPRAVATLAARDHDALPFLGRALRRLLEELPAIDDGLTRSERALLALVADGVVEPARTWRALHDTEDCHYVTDLQLAAMLRDLAARGLVVVDGTLTLTDHARAVLAGRASGRGESARWPGWRWDPVAREAVLSRGGR